MQYLSTLNLVGDLTSVRSRGNLKNLNLGFFPIHIATKLGKVLPSGRRFIKQTLKSSPFSYYHGQRRF